MKLMVDMNLSPSWVEVLYLYDVQQGVTRLAPPTGDL